jgi:hypothetical protein
VTTDEGFFAAAVERISRWMVWLTGMGVLAALALGGWRAAGGFLAGSLASYLNFRWLKRLVEALGSDASGKPPRARAAIFVGLRYLLLAVGGYVILKSSVVSLPAALAGLFVSVAAVILEIIFELVYART